MSRAGTHQGHCQACGRLQVQTARGTIALHGYTVDWGMFNGTCGGSRRAPLEVERTYCDTIRRECRDEAVRLESLAAKMTAGTEHPEQVRSGKRTLVQRPNRQNRIVSEWVDEYIAWNDADDAQRAKGVTETVAHLMWKAGSMHGHARFLFELAASFHGKKLRERDTTKPAAVDVGQVFKLYNREWRVRSIVLRGLGGNTKYAVCERTDGLTWSREQSDAHRAKGGIGTPTEFRPLTVLVRAVRKAMET